MKLNKFLVKFNSDGKEKRECHLANFQPRQFRS